MRVEVNYHLQRVEITESEADQAITSTTIPKGWYWTFDPAASGDRLRLWTEADIHLGAAYGDGHWAIWGKLGHEAQGLEKNLTAALRRLVKVSQAMFDYYY